MAQIRLHVREADGRLPRVCMRCGEPATVVRTRRLSWNPPWVIVLLLVNVLVYIIVAMILTKRATLQAPLCDAHKGHWRNRLLLVLGSFLAMAALGIAGGIALSNAPRHAQDALSGYACLGGALLFVAWVILFAIVHSTSIRPNEITDTQVSLVGVSEEFVAAVDEADRHCRRGLHEDRDRWDEEGDDRATRRRADGRDMIEEHEPHRRGPASDAFEE